MLNLKCDFCNKDYQAKRASSKYCSEACKKASQRISGTEVSGTNNLGGVQKPVSGTKPEVEKKVEYTEAEQLLLNDGPQEYSDADKYATKQYLLHGYFGGKANKSAGSVISISYFNYQGAKNAYKGL